MPRLTMRRLLLALAIMFSASATLPLLAESRALVRFASIPQGSSALKGYSGWFDLNGSLNWGVYANGDANNWFSGANDLVFTRTFTGDSLSFAGLRRMTEGNSPQEVQIHLVNSTAKSFFAYYRITLADARLTSYGFSAEAVSGPPTESFTLSYSRFKVEYHFADSKTPSAVAGLAPQESLFLLSGSALLPVTADADFNLQNVVVSGQSAVVSNEPPSVSSISDITWVENHAGQVLFRATAPQTSSGGLTLSAYSSNPLLLPDEGCTIALVSTNTYRLTMAPLRNTNGQCDVILHASDGTSFTENRFRVTITPGAKVPQISPTLQAVRMVKNGSTTVSFGIIDLDTPVADLLLTATSDNETLFPPSSLVINTTGTFDRQLVLAPAPEQFGVARVTLSLTDGLFVTTQSFMVAVDGQTPGAPTNITLPPTVIDALFEGLPSGTLLGTLTATDPTPSDVHVFTMLDGAGGRFAITNNNQLVVSSGGALLDWEKQQVHRILVQATDLAGNKFTRLFSLGLININDPPQIRYFESPWFCDPAIATPLPTAVVTDQDSGTVMASVYNVQLTLTCSHGVLHVDPSFITEPSSSIVGNGTSSVTVNARMVRITSLLGTAGSITYRSNSGFAGYDTVTLVVNDLNSITTTAIGEGDPPEYIAKSATLHLTPFVFTEPFAAWAHGQFGNDIFDQFLKTQNWGADVDFDQDNFPNLFEYALGYDNTVINTGSGMTASLQSFLPPAAQPAGEGVLLLMGEPVEPPTYNVLSFVVREDPRLVVWVEAANRLLPVPDWSADVSQIEFVSQQSLGNGFRRLTFRDPDPARLFRLYRLGMSYQQGL